MVIERGAIPSFFLFSVSESLVLALLQTYRTGKDQYYNILNTLLEALGEFDDPEIRKAVIEIAMNDGYPLEIRIKAIEKLADISDESVVPSLLPILSPIALAHV